MERTKVRYALCDDELLHKASVKIGKKTRVFCRLPRADTMDGLDGVDSENKDIAVIANRFRFFDIFFINAKIWLVELPIFFVFKAVQNQISPFEMILWVSQVKKTEKLMNSIHFSASDAFTGEQLNQDKSNITTVLSTDPKAGLLDGLIVP